MRQSGSKLFREKLVRGLRPRATGFSLLEVIVAMALASVLLGSVWSLFQILTKRQVIELRQAESNQLIRSLHQRFTRDLNNLPAMEPPAAAAPSSASTAATAVTAVETKALPESALFWPFNLADQEPVTIFSSRSMVLRGDQSTLTLAQFVEPCEWEEFSNVDAPASRRTLDTSSPLLIKEVVYRLPRWPQPAEDWVNDSAELDSDLGIDGDRETPSPQFIREEIVPPVAPGRIRPASGSLTKEDDEFGSRKPIGQQSRAQNFADQDSNDQDIEDQGSRELAASNRRETLEDISVAAFAYFDGYRWRAEWNSELEQRLPVAIRFRWRQTAIPSADASAAAADFSIANPPAELSQQALAVESDYSDNDRFEPATETSADTLESRWYEGEWIFLLQPVAVPPALPARLPAESKFGLQGRVYPGHLERAAESRTAGGHHG